MKKIIFTILFFLLIATPVFAVGLLDSGTMLNSAADEAGYDLSVTTPESVVAKTINAALSMLGVIFLVLMVYGGFIWMTARGNDQQVDKAKGILTAAIIGVIIVVSAYAITFFMLSQVGSQTLK